MFGIALYFFVHICCIIQTGLCVMYINAVQLMYTNNVDSSVHKQIQFENTFYTSLLQANSNIGCPNLQQLVIFIIPWIFQLQVTAKKSWYYRYYQ